MLKHVKHNLELLVANLWILGGIVAEQMLLKQGNRLHVSFHHLERRLGVFLVLNDLLSETIIVKAVLLYL